MSGEVPGGGDRPREVQVGGERLFPIIDVPANVLETYDDEMIFDLVIDELVQRDLYRQGLVYSGFNGALIRASGFDGRTGTYGCTEATVRRVFEAGRGGATPISYMVHEIENRPALAVFDAARLKGGLTPHREHLDEISEERLLRPSSRLIYWATRSGEPLDTAAVAVFMFRTRNNRDVIYK